MEPHKLVIYAGNANINEHIRIGTHAQTYKPMMFIYACLHIYVCDYILHLITWHIWYDGRIRPRRMTAHHYNGLSVTFPHVFDHFLLYASITVIFRSPLQDCNLKKYRIDGALVCMSRWDMPAYPGDVIICWRSCAVPRSGLFATNFLPHDAAFSIHRRCHAPPRGGNWHMYTSRSSGQKALTPFRWSFFVDHEKLFYFVQWVNISKLIFTYLQQEV